jgi:hypothetical protein
MLHRHERTCTGDVIYKYPGGVYHTTQTVFERLEDEGIDVPEENLTGITFRSKADGLGIGRNVGTYRHAE